MWIYLERYPKLGESWILLYKEGSYLLELSGHRHDFFFKKLNPLPPNRICQITYYITESPGPVFPFDFSCGYSFSEDMLPLKQWCHLALVSVGKQFDLLLNGKGYCFCKRERTLTKTNKNSPLYIGGTGISPIAFQGIDWVPFTDGLIDEVRISNKVRYPIEKWEVGVEIQRIRFTPDNNTFALWHFERMTDASGNKHTLSSFGCIFYRVEIAQKLPSLWGRIKNTAAKKRSSNISLFRTLHYNTELYKSKTESGGNNESNIGFRDNLSLKHTVPGSG